MFHRLSLMCGLLISPLVAIETSIEGIQMTNLSVHCHRNEAIKKLRPTIDAWAIENFRSFPYLYVYDGQTDYNTIFEVDPDAFVLTAEKDQKIAALLTAAPLDTPVLKDDPMSIYYLMDEIRQQGFDPSKMLYVSAFLADKEERGNKEMILSLYLNTVEMAKRMGKSQICYIEIVRDKNHPLKPAFYVPLEPWEDLGVDFRKTGVQVKLNWPTLQANGGVKEESHTLDLLVTDI